MFIKKMVYIGWVFFACECMLAGNGIKNQIKVVCTAALLDWQYETRKQEYITAISKIKEMGFMPYIIESCVNGPTFLDTISDRVWYAKTQDWNLHNKGVNEAMALLNFFEHNVFDDDDIIVKITGRYMFADDSFFRYIASNGGCDAFVKYTSTGRLLDIYTACFALRYKYFLDFLKQLDLEKMEKEMICIEWELAYYVESHKNMKVCKLDRLGIAQRISCNSHIDYI